MHYALFELISGAKTWGASWTRPWGLSRARWAPFAAMVCFFQLCTAAEADQGSCFGGATNAAFGTVALSSLQGATTVGNVISGCPPGLSAAGNWDFCASIGVGTNSVSQTDRRMTSGSYYISYQLYTDAGYSNSYQYLGTNMVVVFYTNSGDTFDIQPVYAKILSTGALIPPGTYTDTYTSGTQSSITNDSNPTGNPVSECTGATGTHNWNTTGFMVSVTLSSSCSVSASPLNFGNVGVLNANVDAATNISVSCTYTTPYQVQISAGGGPGATTTSRAMTNGAAEVFYALYQNSGRTTNWRPISASTPSRARARARRRAFPSMGASRRRRRRRSARIPIRSW